MTTVHPRVVRLPPMLPAFFIFLLLSSATDARPRTSADVSPPPGPVIVSLEAMPAADLKSILARAVIRADRLDGAASVSLSVGASTAWMKIPPGDGVVTVERAIPLTRAKPWTPGKPVRFLLIAAVTRNTATLDRRGIRFAMRTLDLKDGRLLLNGAPFQVRAVDPGSAADTTPDALKALRGAGANAILLPPDRQTAAAHDACDAAGLLALDEVPGPGPALTRLRAPFDPIPDALSLSWFGTATGWTAHAREALDDRMVRVLGRIRLDPGHPGFLAEGGPPPGLATRFGGRSLAIAPPPPLIPVDAAASATILAGAGPWPRDTLLEWRVTGGTRSPARGGWRRAPRRTGTGLRTPVTLALPTGDGPGRRVLEVRAISGRRVLATATAGWRAAEFPEPSQYSFALAGDAPAIRALWGAWLIPAEFARVIVVVHPAAIPAGELTDLLGRMRGGQTLVFLELDAADAEALARHPDAGWALQPGAVDRDAPSHLAWLRPERFGDFLPGAARDEPRRLFAGEAFDPLLPDLAISPPPGATVWSGESPLRPGQLPLASVMSVTAGAGKAVFCQWKLLEALPDPLAKRVFERLLGL